MRVHHPRQNGNLNYRSRCMERCRIWLIGHSPWIHTGFANVHFEKSSGELKNVESHIDKQSERDEEHRDAETPNV
jgi:hypothetical protein